MTVNLTSNFLSNARGITLLDGGGATWTINKSTNAVSVAIAGGAGIGTVTSVGLASASGDVVVTGATPITTSGSWDVALKVQAGVTPTSYTYASLTVNSKGVITAVSNGTQPVTSIGSTSLTVGGTTAVPTVNLSSTQIANIALGGSSLQSVSVIDSIGGNGTSGSPLQLIGDALTPGNSFYYGTNGAGTRGWYASVAVPTAANPTGAVGLTAVNGAAATWMRSDAAPALSVAITPTWSGQHIFAAPIQAQHDWATDAGAVQANCVAVPMFSWNISGGTANSKLWRAYANGLTMTFDVAADNQLSNHTFFTITRTLGSNVITAMTYGNSPDNPTHAFSGAVSAPQILANSTGGVGYATGAGGTVAQATSRVTGVALNKTTGAITMFSAAGSATAATFTVTNTLVAAADVIALNQKSGTNLYNLIVTAVAAGSFNITFYTTGGTAVDAPVINFAVIKGATA